MTLVKVNHPFAKSVDGMMKELFNEFPTAVRKTIREEVLHFPPVNIIDQADAYLLELSAPGFEKSDFQVKLDNNLLSISTEKEATARENNEKVIRSEFSVKSFKRSFTLDEKINAEEITAKYENGVLRLSLPKKESAKPLAKEISIA